MTAIFTDENFVHFDNRYYSAHLAFPTAIRALQERAAVTTLLNQDPTLGGGFVMTVDEGYGYEWQNDLYTVAVAGVPFEDDEYEFNWQRPIPPGEVQPVYDFVFESENEQVTIPQFQAALNAVKSIIQNPVPAGMGGKRHRRKTKKHAKKHRSTRRR